jgi:hypothetical protein
MVADGRVDEMIVKGVGVAGAAAINRVTVAFADCADELASVTVTPNEKLPLAVGVPEMIPELAARLSPAGSLPVVTLQVYGDAPPVALRVAVYAALTTP